MTQKISDENMAALMALRGKTYKPSVKKEVVPVDEDRLKLLADVEERIATDQCKKCRYYDRELNICKDTAVYVDDRDPGSIVCPVVNEHAVPFKKHYGGQK